jgi:hypothetical protein
VRLNLEVGRLESRDSTLFAGIELRAGAARVFGDGDSNGHYSMVPCSRGARESMQLLFLHYIFMDVQTIIDRHLHQSLGLSLGIVIRIDVSL